MTVTGRVLDPSGKLVPDAEVMVIVRSKYAKRPLLERAASGAMTAHEGRCDGSGRFRIELPRTTSARQYGLTVTELAALRPADAVILAVAHSGYIEGGWPLIQKLLAGGSGLVFDVKMKLDRSTKPSGIELWRL